MKTLLAAPVTLAAVLSPAARADDAPTAPLPPTPVATEYAVPAPAPTLDAPSGGVQRPGLLAGGIVSMVVGSGVWVGNAFLIHDTISSGTCNHTGGGGGGFLPDFSGLDCGFAVTGETLLGIVGTGAISAGIALTALSFKPRRAKHALDLGPRVDVRVSPTGLSLRGAF